MDEVPWAHPGNVFFPAALKRETTLARAITRTSAGNCSRWPTRTAGGCDCRFGHAAAGDPAGPRHPIADIVLQLLSYVAQMERENIRQR